MRGGIVVRDKTETFLALKAGILAGGGEKKVGKQHSLGKMTARERIATLFDASSFVETDMFVKHRCTYFGMDRTEIPGEGVVTGYGAIDGRLAYVFAQDFTVLGGTLGEMHASKVCKILELALKTGAPVIGINDSGGARIQEAVDAMRGYGDIFYRNTIASGVIPQISVIMGPCAGGATYSPALTDFIFMVDKTSHMFITGPQVIRAVTGEDVAVDALGGPMTHNSVSGVAHFVYPDEATCLAGVRKLIGFLPASNRELPPFVEPSDAADRLCTDLETLLPDSSNRTYDMKKILASVADHHDFFEVQPWYAQNIITGFARVGGRTAGIIANQPQVMAGCIDINASDKAARFISICDSYNVPLLSFVDVPGFMPGTAQEYGGIIRHGAKLLYAYSEASVPKVTVIVRKAYGGAYIAMCSRHLGADMVLAWPTAEIAVMGAEGAANIIFRHEIESAKNPEETRQNKIDEYVAEFSNPWQAAGRGYVDDVIEPAETRKRVASALRMLESKRESRPAKKHGNFPV
ncbi:MAG: methylmalonyl-CoA carboxyltransferase [Synergistaceae bacterium]|jgi:acetyl-CoA carboxylase carboxyltransferase component|nr:methylmalonyl-CoA carboxyltransferase [Synergistaceae bacterium]